MTDSKRNDVLVRVRPAEQPLVGRLMASFGLVVSDKPAPGTSPLLALLDPVVMGEGAMERLRRAAEAFPRTKMLLMAGPQEREGLAALIEVPTVFAIVAREDAELEAELIEALATLTRSGDRATVGLARFVPTETPRFERELVASLDREALLEELEDFLTSTGIRSRMAALARDAIEELITNAIYDAPTDADGRRIYANIDRRDAVFLPAEARPRLEVALHGKRVAASMTDPHGSLDIATVRRYLSQGLRGELMDKAGGAGLGFARIYGLVDRLVVRVDPSARTEVSFTLEAGSRRRDPASRPTGLLMSTIRS